MKLFIVSIIFFTLLYSNKQKDIFMLDYQVLSLPNDKIDFIGLHYLHKINSYLFVDIEAYAPLIYGNYGGFMAFSVGLNLQTEISKNIFINASYSIGGGGGGKSIEQSKELSGTGGFTKKSIGIGYKIYNNFIVGLDYSNFSFKNSQINSSQLGIFIQTPIEFSLFPYKNANKKYYIKERINQKETGIVTLELNNIIQKNSIGKSKKTINSLSINYAHFINDNSYMFFELEIGYKGLKLYNHIIHGIGYKKSLSEKINTYTQIGIGSGGYSPNNIDTGSGLLIYPKVSLEYLLTDKLGVEISTGYLFAPKGTSKNYTIGVGLSYHLLNNFTTLKDNKYNGFRLSIFPQIEFKTKVNNKLHKNINLITLEYDYILNNYIYFPLQMSIANNSYLGYPGYGELLFGVGVQSRYTTSNKFQSFAQILIGTNVNKAIEKVSIGTNYTINDNYALRVALGYTKSINSTKNSSFSAYNFGIGVSYRFSTK